MTRAIGHSSNASTSPSAACGTEILRQIQVVAVQQVAPETLGRAPSRRRSCPTGTACRASDAGIAASSSASFTSVSAGVRPAGTPPATMWSSLPGIQQLVGGAAGDPHMEPVRPADQAVHVHAHRQHAEAGQCAAVEPRQHRAIRVRRGCRTPRVASENSRRPTSCRAIAGKPRGVRQRHAVRRRATICGNAASVAAKCRLHPADLAAPMRNGSRSPGRLRIVAGANMAEEPSRSPRWPSARLSNRHLHATCR